MSQKRSADHYDSAAALFARRLQGDWSRVEQAELDTRLRQDAAFAQAFAQVERSWQAVGQHAAAPELMAFREQAIARARRAGAGRWQDADRSNRAKWRIAAALIGAALLATALQLSPFGYRPGSYSTAIGEQKTIELDDHSRITLDANTHLQVRFSADARIVQLIEGQAQFSVAKDPARPFKVEAGSRTIVAIGTAFTVEYVEREIRVAMLEGKVAVLTESADAQGLGQNPGAVAASSANTARDSVKTAGDRANANKELPLDKVIELIAGEALRVGNDGNAVVIPKADLEVATAWRHGKIIFHSEPLGDAVRRLNRYSRKQLEIENPDLASLRVNGVFEAGDAQAFAEAVQAYLPVDADYTLSGKIRLRMK